MRQLKNETLKCNLVQFKQTTLGPIYVYENAQYRWLTLDEKREQDAVIQGVMSKSKSEQVLVPVNQSMLLFLLKPVTNLKMLNLGLGTAGVERVIYYLFNKTKFLNTLHSFNTVEINPDVVEIAQTHFYLPKPHSVFLQSAEQFIQQCKIKYDVITIDIFSGEYHQPFLNSALFWQNMTRCCNSSSQITLNLNPKTGQELQLLLALLRKYFKAIALVEFNEYKNIVIVLSPSSLKHISVDNIQDSDVFKHLAPNLYQDINHIYHIESF